jgi:hypothetical protein
MIAGCLDEYWETKRPQGMKPDDIAAWLDEKGGYTVVYRDRRDRLHAPKDKAEVRYNRYLKMKPLEERQIPDCCSGVDGEVLISASIDRATGLLRTRSVWQPKGKSFWYSHVEKFVAARPATAETGADRPNAVAGQSSSAPQPLSTPAGP